MKINKWWCSQIKVIRNTKIKDSLQSKAVYKSNQIKSGGSQRS